MISKGEFSVFPAAMLLATCAAACAADVSVTSFERQSDQAAWTGGTIVRQYASEGARSLRIAPGSSAIGVLHGNWSAYRYLKFDVCNPGQVLLVGIRVTDASGHGLTAFEYSVYSGPTTQYVRIDGLANDFGVREGIDVAHVASVEIQVGQRWKYDRVTDGIYVDNLRLSTAPTQPFQERVTTADRQMQKPAGFLLPEFAGFEAGYNTFAIDPDGYQLLARPGTGRTGTGRALEMKPLSVDQITVWDNPPRVFPLAGTYAMDIWAKGPVGATLAESWGPVFQLSPDWTRFRYEFNMQAGGSRRFIFVAKNLQGQSVWLDDFVVYRKAGGRDLEPVSTVSGTPSTVNYADGICYLNGKPTFMLGFVRSDPDRLKGTPLNFCFPNELMGPSVEFVDKCARYGLWTSVNLTATLRSMAPDNAAWFAEKYRSHPALFSYYLCDEPNHSSPSAGSEPPVLARATQVLHAADPRHLTQTIVIPWCSSAVYRFRDTTDILGGDKYVVNGSPNNSDLWTVYQANYALKRSGTEGQVNIFTPLAVSNITREENWAQAYMCVAAGAGGILWFEFGGAQGQWADFLELGRELVSINEFLVGVELNRGLKFENDVLPAFVSGDTTYHNFAQIRGIGRAGTARTALITVNLTPVPAPNVKITAPFLAHAKRATVMFENRTVPVVGGVIVDSYAGLQRHVYVVDGLPSGVHARPAPRVGGSHVTDAGAAWRE